jgi:hypothetical protein
MNAPSDARPPKARSTLARWALSVAIVATLGIVGTLGWAWAQEPSQRNPTTVAFELPLKLGTRVEQAFTAQTDWMFEVRITIDHPRPNPQEAARFDGPWIVAAPPAGLVIAYVVDADRGEVARGKAETFETGSSGNRRTTSAVIDIEHGERIPYRLALEVISAPPEFEDFAASIEVGPVGDFISYRSLEGQLRHMVLFVGFGLGLALAFAWLIMLWRPRRKAA